MRRIDPDRQPIIAWRPSIALVVGNGEVIAVRQPVETRQATDRDTLEAAALR